MKKTMLMVAIAAFVAALAGCGGGGGSVGGVPLAVKMGTTPAVVPSIPKGASSVKVTVTVTFDSYGTTMVAILKDDATGTIVGQSGGPGSTGTTGPMGGEMTRSVDVTTTPKTLSLYIDGKREDTITLTANCVPGTAPDANGVCN